jgi:hypothetical protein
MEAIVTIMHHHRVEVEVITMPQVHLLRLQVVDSTRAMVENQEVVTPITRTALARDLINNISRKISLLSCGLKPTRVEI